MRTRFKLLVAGFLAACLAAPAFADLTYTQGAGTTIFDFICFTTKHCSSHVNINSAGTEIGTAANPIAVMGATGSVTQTSVSITNASTTLSAAAAFGNFGKVCVPATASTGVWVRWDGGTAGVVPPAEYIPPGQCDSWIKASGYLPNQQWNAISNSAATIAVTLIGN